MRVIAPKLTKGKARLMARSRPRVISTQQADAFFRGVLAKRIVWSKASQVPVEDNE